MRRENESKMKSKRRLFAKWATPPHFVSCLLFRGFSMSFSVSFSLHNLNSAFRCHCTTHHRDPCSSPLPPDSANHHNNDQWSRQQPTNTTCNHPSHNAIHSCKRMAQTMFIIVWAAVSFFLFLSCFLPSLISFILILG
jgi:hypothetical protein